jgi:HD-GYP domain-containing protein (c-di-GMP phosphodiesterase class II)
MIDIGTSQGLLSSLSEISQLKFQVWDVDEGLIYASAANQPSEPTPEELQDFSVRTMSQAGFLHAPSQSKEHLFGVPIRDGERVIGSLTAFGANTHKQVQPKTIQSAKAGDTEGMERFLMHVTALLEDKLVCQQEVEDMAEQLTQTFEDLHLYASMTARIKTLLFSATMLKDMIEELLEIMRADLAFARVLDRQEYDSLASKEEVSGKIPNQDSFVDSLINAIPLNAPSLEENYFIVNDSRLAPGYRDQFPEPYRFLAVKMLHNGKFYGWLGLVSFKVAEIFHRSELRLLNSMAEQIAVVITNSDLYRDLERFVFNVVKSLVNAIEAKDDYTRGHSERVSKYSLFMAERLGLDEEQKKVLHWAAILHDSGKIGMPESILNKPGRLDEEEYEVFKNHPMKGHEILRPIKQLESSFPGILYHHERYDGTGYPQGMRGKEIPLEARIIAVADTFDAMTSDRAYRPAKPPQEALKEIVNVSGTQLDPDLVEVFKEVFTQNLGCDQECSLEE